ncbi:hypothetical protein HYPSUDRAFT_52190 [Hypholoma sublateritium FD-334 SS-4]|uniref:Mid2 domain-containing protein n=1 Tax=Hypholoma sublateritium (strain FD-334 SS-4) TaxID=945553 RepID=A0A0D2Q6G2_HYPSF|nr:hypothetical protein HYPSUDRAFT_52190 [Hypholoma sublateritium FD-334 SS-4]
MAVASIAQSAPPSRSNTTSVPPIQAFKLRAQNRKREPLAFDALLVRRRTQPLREGKPKVFRKRQISATLATPTPSTTVTIFTTISSNEVTEPTGKTQPAPPVVTVTVISPPPETVTLTESGVTQTLVVVPPEVTLSLTAQPGVTETVIALPPETLTITPQPGVTETVIETPSETFTIALPTVTAIQQSPTLGSNPGATTVTISRFPGHGSPGSPTSTSSLSPLSPNSANSQSRMAAHHVPAIVGGVIGGLAALLILLILLVLCRRRRNQRRATGPVLLADPFQDEPPPMEQQRDFNDVTTPSPYHVPSPFQAAMVATPGISLDVSPQSSSPAPRGKFVKGTSTTNIPHAREDSISTTHSPPSVSPQDSYVTMAELNALRTRILEVENLALRQRIHDVENLARAGPSGTAAAETTNPPRASESPPEYASPIDEAQPTETH